MFGLEVTDGRATSTMLSGGPAGSVPVYWAQSSSDAADGVLSGPGGVSARRTMVVFALAQVLRRQLTVGAREELVRGRQLGRRRENAEGPGHRQGQRSSRDQRQARVPHSHT